MPDNQGSTQSTKTLWTKLLAIIILGGILAIIFTQTDFFKKPGQTQTEPTSQTNQTSTTPDYQIYQGPGVTIQYPKSWIIQGKQCSDAGGIECIQLAPLAAIEAYQKKYGNNSLSFTGLATVAADQSVRDYMTYMAGSGPFAEDKDLTINGYPAVFIKSVVPDAYTDYYYVVGGKEKLTYFYFRSYSEWHPEGQPAQIDDYSEYLSDFQSIVNSIKFN
jgi:hypothetical protein